MIHVLGLIEDEQIFSSLGFLKNDSKNKLHLHLALVVGMHAQKVYKVDIFLYDDCCKQWVHGAKRYHCGIIA